MEYPFGLGLHEDLSYKFKPVEAYNWIISEYSHIKRSWGNPVSIVSDYGLDDQAIEVQSLAEAKNFSSNLCVQTGSGAHPAPCPMGIRGPFPRNKARPRRDADHSLLSSAEVMNE
jgi:hypothetical protein